MDNAHLFDLLNAGPGLAPAKLLVALLLAKWLIAAVPVAGVLLATLTARLTVLAGCPPPTASPAARKTSAGAR